MFSKTKLNDPNDPSKSGSQSDNSSAPQSSGMGMGQPRPAAAPATQMGARQPKPAPSIISNDLIIKGNLETSGDMQIEGTIEGDIRSHLLTIGQTALVRGEIVADDVVVNGKIIGRIRAHKVRLSATAKVEGDILHKNIAIESGAQFEGSVLRSEDPLNDTTRKPLGSASVTPINLASGSDPNGVGV